jgi:transcriptional regulator with XRE-family HTH domain
MDVTREVIRLVQEHEGKKSELFRRAGVTPATYYQWKNRDRSPNFGALEAVAIALGYRIKLEKVEP